MDSEGDTRGRKETVPNKGHPRPPVVAAASSMADGRGGGGGGGVSMSLNAGDNGKEEEGEDKLGARGSAALISNKRYKKSRKSLKGTLGKRKERGQQTTGEI